ncbi:bromodomain and PHD finger-containing protein 3 [Mycena polygramma]|nr:bromodomain and PHD finger-containing protein 3 [Mycena polygramma]
MARGGHVSPVATMPVLPKVSFQKIEDDISTQPSGVHDSQARSFGYNDFSDFYRPDQYIRHIEPLEIDLERQVEYDMDEQDQEWLDAVNAERKKEQLDKVTYEVFEVVMDRLEKEWFNLTKHIPKPDLALPSEDSTCAICDDSEGENSNAIVFCDGCNLAVHQDCYGIPYIPEGQWLCRKCTVSPENPVSCTLCPNEGGAFKQTTQGEWIHLLCAIWVPETRVSNDVFMEPIIGVDKVSKQRWKLKCLICGTREGACIQCGKSSCFLAFHVTCARKEKLLLPMKSAQGVEPGALTAFCDKHLPKEQAAIREAAQLAEEEEEDDPYKSAQLSKSARAYAKTYKPGPPLVPAIIIDRILQYINRTKLRKKPEFVAMMCKYWSLKREARRGAPLLKRLHLEPWTASTGSRSQGEEEKVMKLEQLKHLRKDLEDLRGLTELSRKRETRKLRQAELIYDFLGSALFVHLPKLRAAFDRITGLDRNDYFKLPVNKKDVPDYFDIVKKPYVLETTFNWFLTTQFLYNKHGTPFQKTALRIQIAAQPILAELDHLSSAPNLRTTELIEGSAPPWTPSPIGDLEPPLEILELLVSSEVIQDESELILSADPITSLFNFELENRKPAPPPPTPPPDEREEKNRKRREADRTRGAIAAAVAFETEANARASSSISAPRGRPKGSTNKSKLPPPASQSESSRATRQRQPSAPLPAPGDIPLVDHIDQKGSFTMFEQGWILPPGHRRGGRVPLERTTAPPPKKKIRLARLTSMQDGGTSRLSVFSTAASDNQTLQTGSPPLSSRAATDADNSMDVDEGERPPRSKGKAANISVDSGHLRLHSLPMVTPERVTIPPPNVIRTPDGQVIVEELDTPAIRKEKLLRRKEERAAAKAAAAADAASSSQSQMEIDDAEPLSPVPPSPVDDASMADAYAEADADADADVDTDGDSDLSDLSDIEADPGPSKPGPDADGDQDKPDEGKEPPNEGQDAPGDDVEPADEPAEVSFPWWPALVYDDTDAGIPSKVLAEAQAQRKKRKGQDWLYIVRFWDKTKSWYELILSDDWTRNDT